MCFLTRAYRRCIVHKGGLFWLGGSRFFNFQLGDDHQDVALEFPQSGIVRTEIRHLLHLLQRRTKEVDEAGGLPHASLDAQTGGDVCLRTRSRLLWAFL